jgi:hypothetical protein
MHGANQRSDPTIRQECGPGRNARKLPSLTGGTGQSTLFCAGIAYVEAQAFAESSAMVW